tara:strand:- start:2036 stop:2233 length:198 start_codon:yes stop_codon:yes gene_type:complete
MNALIKKNLKNKFKAEGVQLSADMIEVIDEHINRELYNMAKRCKKGNVKRLTPDLMWIALGRMME